MPAAPWRAPHFRVLRVEQDLPLSLLARAAVGTAVAPPEAATRWVEAIRVVAVLVVAVAIRAVVEASEVALVEEAAAMRVEVVVAVAPQAEVAVAGTTNRGSPASSAPPRGNVEPMASTTQRGRRSSMPGVLSDELLRA